MLTIADTIDHARRNFPEREALACGDVRLTYASFYDRCRRLVGAMQDIGVQPGDRIAVLASNCHRYVELFAALPSGGFVFVPLNYRLAEAELGAIIADSGARVLITDRDPGQLTAAVKHVLRWPADLEAALAAATPAVLGVGVQPSDLAALFYTGGTTGKPKGVMLSHENIVSNSFHKTIAVGLRSDEVFLAAPAMFHVAGIAPLLSLMTLGARTVVTEVFEPDVSLDLIEQEHCTMMMPVPTMLAAMVQAQVARPRDLSALRLLGHAASPISTELLRQASATFPGVDMAEFYGATETTAIVTCQHHEELMVESPLVRSCGQPVPGVSVRVLDGSGAEANPGAIGEVIVQSRAVMMGYWQNPEATAQALKGGWFHTGDLGYVDGESNLFLVDRAKDMIVTGGENVYSIEVENALASHPDVIEVAVFGIPNERWGEAVHAVVVSATTSSSLAGELTAHCRGLIAGFKVPKSIDIQTEPLPKSGPGKVLKRSLRDAFWQGHGGQIV
jgi:long-chain acyl-CoA synthetase